MTGILWLGAYLVLPICGWPLLSHPAFRRFSIAARLVLSGAAGAVLLSFAMTVAVLVGLKWRTGVLVLASAVLAWLLRRLAGPASPAAPPPGADDADSAVRRLAHAVSFAAVAAALVAAFAGAASSPDLLFFWGPKAQAYAIARTIDPGFLGAPFHRFMHPYYPPLVTNLYAFASMAAGRLPWTAAILTFPALLAALALGLPGTLRGGVGRSRAAAVSALAVAAIACAGIEADIGGNGEMPLLLFETLAMALLLSPDASERPAQLLAGVLLAGAAVTKVEGLPFALAAALLAVLARRRPGRGALPSLLALLGPSAGALGVWFAFGASRGLFTGYSESGRFLDLYPARLLSVVETIVRNLLAAGHGLAWIVPIVVLFASLPLGRGALVPLTTAAVLAAFFVFTYLHRPEDPSLWISWSAARIFTPIAMLLAVAAACPETDVAGREARTREATPG